LSGALRPTNDSEKTSTESRPTPNGWVRNTHIFARADRACIREIVERSLKLDALKVVIFIARMNAAWNRALSRLDQHQI
jgi:hypothetical protein